MAKHIANIITGFRFVGSIILLFYPTFSVGFYIIYILCGFSDMIDGTIARITNSVCEMGAKIDSVADLTFIIVCLIKILPILNAPHWLWIWGIFIAMIKLRNYVCGYAKKKKFITLHTTLNKITGMLLFLFPLTLSYIEFKYGAFLVCTIATFAAIQEGIYITTKHKY